MSNRSSLSDAQEPETGNRNEQREAQAEENLAEQYRVLQDQFTRLAADFENYRKRMREEHESLLKYGARKSILELLPVLDNLDRASTGLREDSDPKVLYKSFQVLQKQLTDALDAMGVKKIQTIGQPFDPHYHEAVSRMPSAEHPEDVILHETQSGYELYDKVLRPAMVVVSMGAPEASESVPKDGGEDNATGSSVEESRANPFAAS